MELAVTHQYTNCSNGAVHRCWHCSLIQTDKNPISNLSTCRSCVVLLLQLIYPHKNKTKQLINSSRHSFYSPVVHRVTVLDCKLASSLSSFVCLAKIQECWRDRYVSINTIKVSNLHHSFYKVSIVDFCSLETPAGQATRGCFSPLLIKMGVKSFNHHSLNKFPGVSEVRWLKTLSHRIKKEQNIPHSFGNGSADNYHEPHQRASP